MLRCRLVGLALVLAGLGVAHHGFGEDAQRVPGPRRAAKATPKAPVASKEVAAKDADPDARLYVAKCGRCHEVYGAGVDEMTWNRWIWKWKDKARLSDEEYDRLMAYARREREARLARLAPQGPAK
ncbi:MAG: hypothetical protein IT577_23085 [Verrucomicrobiae bacterium]|nr:hypothetical protein [Verrucomicrobiae bacterium]